MSSIRLCWPTRSLALAGPCPPAVEAFTSLRSCHVDESCGDCQRYYKTWRWLAQDRSVPDSGRLAHPLLKNGWVDLDCLAHLVEVVLVNGAQELHAASNVSLDGAGVQHLDCLRALPV